MSIKIAPVDIGISNPKRFADVAFLVDRDDFLADILKLRKKFSKYHTLPLKSPPHKKNWFTFPWRVSMAQMEKYSKAVKPLEKIAFDLNQTSEMDIKEKEAFLKSYEKAERLLPQNDFRFSILDIRKKYKRPPNSDRIIAHAALYNKIADEDYVTSEASIKHPELEFPQYFDDPQIIITVYPGFDKDDIEGLLKNKVYRLMEENQKEYITIDAFKLDVRGNIKRDRKWYWWKKQEDLGWIKLGRKVAVEEDTLIAQDTVRDAVNRYKEKLTMMI